MDAADPPSRSPVKTADPSRLYAPRHLIANLLRTRYCIPGSILLVEGIETHISMSKRHRAVRLLLGDGELCVQALLRPDLHQRVESGQVTIGCYVLLVRFEVKSLLARSDRIGAGRDAEEPKEMVFLEIRDLSVVGRNAAYIQMAGATIQQLPMEGPETSAREMDRQPETSGPFDNAKSSIQSRTMDSVVSTESRNSAEPQQTSSCSAIDSLPWAARDLSKPLKLTPLKAIPNLPYKQNWVVNILAIVASLSDVEPAALPPYKQRSARLVDSSTSKQVHLTVFLDPDDFVPAVGSVVLLLGVKNHRFDGGSLKKYGNEKVKDDLTWWLENPIDLDWCDVEGLKKWWTPQEAS